MTIIGRRRLNAKQYLIVGFSSIIFIGAVLLMLPAANKSGASIPFVNALFTAASATCVTGLVVYDTWSQFTMFGQFVIMILIQIGGLGFMTFAILLSMALGKRIGLRDRFYLMEAINAMQLGGVVRLVRRIIFGTLYLEFFGAVILSTVFIPMYGRVTGIWFSIFHSVSAFCNAGFDLMGIVTPYGSFVPFVGNTVVSGTLIILIILGGVGFVVWDDVIRSGWRLRQMNLHTKITVSFTIGLILLSTGAFMILEWNTTLAGLSMGDKVLAALFQSVTPRTAGFNTIDTASLSTGGSLLTIILMFIGAGPGSTAGGIKVTTLAVLLLSVLADLQNKAEVTAFRRRLDYSQIKRAFTSTTSYLLIVFAGCMAIAYIQPLSFHDVIFEAFSAMGTVGLSRGITRDLVPLSRIVIIGLMYAGRLGSLTVFMAMSERKNCISIKHPLDKVVV
jgi:trk system potassium uptake protein TrkH